ncbi:hypothetical protein GOV08_01900 [Candidatus Woesearchaeota archaeon]|nr:hypothetical protein [Candidatus Woesearchaeota archaeon]
MTYEYADLKIIKKEANGKLASIFSLRYKGAAHPGQYISIWVPGIGQETFPIAHQDSTGFNILVTKKSDVSKNIFPLKKGLILVKGPFGHGFPMNNLKKTNLVMIGQTHLFSPLWFALSYVKENKTSYLKTSIVALQTKPKKAFIENLKKASSDKNINLEYTEKAEDFKKLIKKIKFTKNTNVLLSLKEEYLKEVLSLLKSKKVQNKNIYFYLHRKMNCAQGICGSCAVLGEKTCVDGPVFRFDDVLGFFE